MDCLRQTSEAGQDFFSDFHLKVSQERIPLFGSIELTRRCQFRCVHCYLGEKRQVGTEELDTSAWKGIIDQIVDAGCLFLTFTGGEAVLRDDFIEIYTHARQKGLIITLFSNGFGISDELILVFSDYKPQAIEITLYGATDETHGRITGRPGTFKTCIANIKRLLRAGIQVRLKTVLMTENAHEFSAMEQIARDFKVRFRFDPAIFPDFSGNTGPTRYRVDPSFAVSCELSSDQRLGEWRTFSRRMRRWKHTGFLYECGAGSSNFHIDPGGRLQPCILVTDIGYDLTQGDFITGWGTEIARILEMKVDATFSCVTCDNQIYCGFCPAFFRLESGSETGKSPYLCAIGGLMARALQTALGDMSCL